ncbi:MAG: SBBP repeat-containing protein [Patescibacteria group bacterium]
MNISRAHKTILFAGFFVLFFATAHQALAFITPQWTNSYSPYSFRGVTLDPRDGAVFAIGYQTGGCFSACFKIIKVSSSTGSYLPSWNGAGFMLADTPYDDQGYAVAVDSLGNVYVVGYVNPSTPQYRVMKFNSAGTLLWEKTYENVPGSGVLDQAYDLALDEAGGNLFVGGSSGIVKHNILTGTTSSYSATSSSALAFSAGKNKLFSCGPFARLNPGNLLQDWAFSAACLMGNLQLDSASNPVGMQKVTYEGSDYVLRESPPNIRATIVDVNDNIIDIGAILASRIYHYGDSFQSVSVTDMGGADAVLNDQGDIFLVGGPVAGMAQIRKYSHNVTSNFGVYFPNPITWGDAIVSGGPVKASQIIELQTRVNERRTGNGTSTVSFTDGTLSAGMAVKALHMNELRRATEGMYGLCGKPLPTWTDGASLSIGMPVKARHFNELRNAINRAPYCPVKKVFVTSQRHDGNFTSIGGPNGFCQNSANGAGLSGTYKAWIDNTNLGLPYVLPMYFGTATTSPILQLPNGTVVAYGYTDLMDGTLLNPINRSEYGLQVTTATQVWTGPTANGERGTSVNNCTFWENNISGSGDDGLLTSVTSSWTDTEPSGITCPSALRVYCFEQ